MLTGRLMRPWGTALAHSCPGTQRGGAGSNMTGKDSRNQLARCWIGLGFELCPIHYEEGPLE